MSAYPGGGAWFQHSLMSAVWNAECSGPEKSILVLIAWHAKPGGGGAYPSVRRLAKLSCFARSTVEQALAQLIGRGYITVTRRGSQTTSNEYKISLAKLLENQIEGVPASGTEGVPASGTEVSRQVSRQVSRLEGFSVPVAGTEQTTTQEQLEQEAQHPQLIAEAEAEAVWSKARARVKENVTDRTWETWFQVIRAAKITGKVLHLRAPGPEWAHAMKHPDAKISQCVHRAASELNLDIQRVALEWLTEDQRIN